MIFDWNFIAFWMGSCSITVTTTVLWAETDHQCIAAAPPLSCRLGIPFEIRPNIMNLQRGSYFRGHERTMGDSIQFIGPSLALLSASGWTRLVPLRGTSIPSHSLLLLHWIFNRIPESKRWKLVSFSGTDWVSCPVNGGERWDNRERL